MCKFIHSILIVTARVSVYKKSPESNKTSTYFGSGSCRLFSLVTVILSVLSFQRCSPESYTWRHTAAGCGISFVGVSSFPSRQAMLFLFVFTLFYYNFKISKFKFLVFLLILEGNYRIRWFHTENKNFCVHKHAMYSWRICYKCSIENCLFKQWTQEQYRQKMSLWCHLFCWTQKVFEDDNLFFF